MFLLDFQQKSPFCYSSCIKNGLRSRMVTKVGALESCDLGASLDTLNMHFTPLENFLEAPEVEVVTQNCSNSVENLESQPLILLDFPKNQLFVTFPSLTMDCEVIWSRKFML